MGVIVTLGVGATSVVGDGVMVTVSLGAATVAGGGVIVTVEVGACVTVSVTATVDGTRVVTVAAAGIGTPLVVCCASR